MLFKAALNSDMANYEVLYKLAEYTIMSHKIKLYLRKREYNESQRNYL
jgi:hypothetical protein